MRQHLRLLAIVTLAIAAITAAGSAHADDDSFIRAIDATGIPYIRNGVLSSGYEICLKLRAGATPDVAMGSLQVLGIPGLYSHALLDAAQHELCPDTLG
ncbi:MAG TPA: DUF732 domain-containing protein [Mycobacterium sp.]|nr:DUF732 domain-containing protein [Mycobacterium sp.]